MSLVGAFVLCGGTYRTQRVVFLVRVYDLAAGVRGCRVLGHLAQYVRRYVQCNFFADAVRLAESARYWRVLLPHTSTCSPLKPTWGETHVHTTKILKRQHCEAPVRTITAAGPWRRASTGPWAPRTPPLRGGSDRANKPTVSAGPWTPGAIRTREKKKTHYEQCMRD